MKHSNTPLIAPSILAADFSCLADEVKKIEIAGADMLHIDVMDGQFVPPITIGDCVVAAIRGASSLPFDVHLMINDTNKQIEAFARAGADSITFHIENNPNPKEIIQQIRSFDKHVGVSLNPGTPVEAIQDVIPMVDLVLVMSVNPGWGGQKYIDTANDKIKKIRSLSPSVLIEVDGGINEQTAKQAIDAGANILVAGSFVFGNNDYKGQIDKLKLFGN